MAVNKTLSQIAQKVIIELSFVNGTSTQKYSLPRIKQYVQKIFDILYKDRYWRQFSGWQSGTLDGSTGVVTADLTSILTEWNDLGGVWYESDKTQLPVLGRSVPPSSLSGTRAKAVDSIGTAKIFRVYPVTATGTVYFYCRTNPGEFGDDDAINFDDSVLINGAAYLFSEDDATNPGAIEKFRNLFEARKAQLELIEQQHPISLNFDNETIPSEWT